MTDWRYFSLIYQCSWKDDTGVRPRYVKRGYVKRRNSLTGANLHNKWGKSVHNWAALVGHILDH